MNPPVFTKDIPLRDEVRRFYLYRLPAYSPAWCVEVGREGGGRLSFSMIRAAGGRWRAVSNRLPLWIVEAEAELAAALDMQVFFV